MATDDTPGEAPAALRTDRGAEAEFVRPRRAPGDTARRPGGDPWKAAFVLIAVAGIVAAVVWALVGSRLLVVRSVDVTGLHRVTRSQVIAAAGITHGVPLARVDTSAVRRRVERIDQVRSAHVSRSWPDGIDIAVTERVPALAVRSAGRYQLIDPAGVTVVTVPRRPPGMALFTPSGPVRGNAAVAAAAAVVRQLPAQLSRRVVSVGARTADSVTLRLSRGVTVFWGGAGQAASKQRTLAVLMRTHARYYDVSMPGTAATR